MFLFVIVFVNVVEKVLNRELSVGLSQRTRKWGFHIVQSLAGIVLVNRNIALDGEEDGAHVFC